MLHRKNGHRHSSDYSVIKNKNLIKITLHFSVCLGNDNRLYISGLILKNT